MLIDFREREGERERGKRHGCERETMIICFIHALSRDRTHNLGIYLDLELNLQHYGLWDTPTN